MGVTNEIYYSELISRYFSGNCQPEEVEALLEWAQETPENQAYLEELSQLWDQAATEDIPFQTNVELAWGKVADRLFVLEEIRPLEVMPSESPGRAIRLNWKMAAAILALLSLGLWWYAFQAGPASTNAVATSISTKPSQQATVLLPDGSKVWLNEETTVEYEETTGERFINLTGEAYFDVEKDSNRPFVILTRRVRTEVLGTEFNIRAYPEEKKVEVSVAEGSVKVELLDALANNATVLDERRLDRQTAISVEQTAVILPDLKPSPPKITAWKEGDLNFADQTPLTGILEALGRYHRTEIQFDPKEIAGCVANPDFTGSDLAMASEILYYSLGVKLEASSNGYRLDTTDCNCCQQ